MTRLMPLLVAVSLLAGCPKPPPPVNCPAPQELKAPAPAAEAKAGCKYSPLADPEAAAGAWMKETEAQLLSHWINTERANWVKNTNITFDTELLAAKAYERLMAFTAGKAAEAVCRFGPHFADLPEKMQRKFKLLRLTLSLPAPQDAAQRAELASIATFMESTYGKGKHCPERLKGKCLSLPDMYQVLANSRSYDELLDVWTGWRKVSVPMRDKFQRYVELGNAGAKGLGFSDLGALWRSRYDITPEAFEKEVDRLWGQVKPLYDDLHCHVRAQLQKKYGKAKVPDGKPIPAHLLGNMWAQDWANLFPMMQPTKEKGFDLTSALKKRKVDAVGMTKYAEGFFVSLGLDPLPKTFWDRSMLVKPEGREVVCHASAWDVDWVDDLRIKMCIRTNAEDFTTIHHELGHNYYQRAYNKLDPLFRDSANDGFHEALGDVISLSVTPKYLRQVKLLKKEPKGQLNALMLRALEKIAFLPFGVVVDSWRWRVFSGRIKPADYNKGWWELRTKYQGIAPAVERSEKDFDPGAKFHIPANVPYTRYFLAAILQFQFHRALCKVVGHEGPLHQCSIYGNKEAGKKLNAMMAMGISRPWVEALEALTGQRQMDATAILGYFEPLHKWLKEQNKGRKCGWSLPPSP